MWREALHISRRPALLAGVRGARSEPPGIDMASWARAQARHTGRLLLLLFLSLLLTLTVRAMHSIQVGRGQRQAHRPASGRHLRLGVPQPGAPGLYNTAAIGCYPVEKPAPQLPATGRSSARCGDYVQSVLRNSFPFTTCAGTICDWECQPARRVWFVRFWATSFSFKCVRFCATSFPVTICAWTICDW